MHPLLPVPPADLDYVRRLLRASYGLSPPERVVRLYAHALVWARASSDRPSDRRWLFSEFVDPFTCLVQDETYDIPEFFDVASPRTDGIQYGFLVHAPELPTDELPFAEHAPRDYDPIMGLGESSRAALGVLLSRAMARAAQASAVDFMRELDFGAVCSGPTRDKSSHMRLLQDLARALDVELTEGTGSFICCREPAPIPSVPDGWSFVPTLDGVGVLAPAPKFAPEGAELDLGLEASLQQALRLLDDGHPATALVVLRNALFTKHEGTSFLVFAREEHPAHIEAMRRSYLALSRPLLADRLTGEAGTASYERLVAMGVIRDDDEDDEGPDWNL